MTVRVDQAGHDETRAQIDDGRLRRRRDNIGLPDSLNVAGLVHDEDGICDGVCAGSVEQGAAAYDGRHVVLRQLTQHVPRRAPWAMAARLSQGNGGVKHL